MAEVFTTKELLGRDTTRGKKLTKEFEGFDSFPYVDEIKQKDDSVKDVLTSGYGFNLDDPEIQKILPEGYLAAVHGDLSRSAELSQPEADKIFDVLYERAEKDAVKYLGSQKLFDELDNDLQDNLVDMSYNLGLTELKGFDDMKEGFLAKDRKKIADEMKDSDWYTQTGRRGRHHVETTQGKRSMLDLSALNPFSAGVAEAG